MAYEQQNESQSPHKLIHSLHNDVRVTLRKLEKTYEKIEHSKNGILFDTTYVLNFKYLQGINIKKR